MSEKDLEPLARDPEMDGADSPVEGNIAEEAKALQKKIRAEAQDPGLQAKDQQTHFTSYPEFRAENYLDEAGNPTGGYAVGQGLAVRWQDGPLGRGTERREPNGAFVETLIKVASGRLEFYQASRFTCTENAEALEYLRLALWAMNRRTRSRDLREVEGTHTV